MADPIKKMFGVKSNSSQSFSTPPRQSAGIADDFAVRKSLNTQEGTIEKVPVNDNDIANKKYVDDEQGNHDIADHNDTSATGTELNTLTDNSMADTLHRHSELSASDGDPDAVLSVDANGKVIITNSYTDSALTVDQNANTGAGAGAIEVKNDGNTGAGLRVESSQDASQARPLVELQSTNGAFDQPIIDIGQDGTGKGIFIDMNGNGIALDIDSEATTAAGINLDITGTGPGIVVDGAGTGYSAIFNNGNVGIGVTDPDAPLEVAGDVHISNSGDLIIGSTTLTEAQLIALLALLE